MATDSSLAVLMGSSGAAILAALGVFVDRYFRMRKQLLEVKGTESQTNRDIAQDRSDEGSLKLLLQSAEQWKRQYEASVSREVRYRRQLAVAEARMRRFVKQAAEDRDEDRRKFEALTRRVEMLEQENSSLKSQLRGRRAEDQS